MKKWRYSEVQIACVMWQAEGGTSVAEICSKIEIREASFYA